MGPGVCLVPAGCLLSNKVTDNCVFFYSNNRLLSDCAFGVDLAATSLDPTIETMIEFTVGKDATISENLQL